MLLMLEGLIRWQNAGHAGHIIFTAPLFVLLPVDYFSANHCNSNNQLFLWGYGSLLQALDISTVSGTGFVIDGQPIAIQSPGRAGCDPLISVTSITTCGTSTVAMANSSSPGVYDWVFETVGSGVGLVHLISKVCFLCAANRAFLLITSVVCSCSDPCHKPMLTVRVCAHACAILSASQR